MLSKEENELLTRTGPGTPMGALLRRYWLPALLPEEVPTPDCPPVRIRLLGEDLVALRDSNGQVGLVAAHCPHRGASLFFGRNEDAGLRCVYHGWKFDVTGQCVDMPNEPAESNFKSKIKATAYPCCEAGGMIWTYMGPMEHMPEIPQLEWTLLPESHYYVHKRFQQSSYLQNVEGEVDSAHVSFLHRSFGGDRLRGSVQGQTLLGQATDSSPVFTVQETDYGLAIGARRNWETDQYYWRITQFLMPTYTMIPAEIGATVSFTAAVPVDDERMVGYTVTWHPTRPLTETEIANIESWRGIYAEVDPRTYQPLCVRANDYQLDREKQRSESFTGIRGIREQDLAVQEDQFGGPIADRTREHLGTSDAAVIALRQRLLRTLHDMEQGREPPEPTNGAAYLVRSAALLLPRSAPFAEAAQAGAVLRT
ncbi:MAG: phthalate 4,5-dioxygenase [Chloroflexota bacterium]|jgi:phenylpropionate dioxygenase-like ring-hydroxylating dioxygenase large terminal subunit|nr:phthalate 4,5-dioxygenase [Chloroflexota bacterium]